LCSFFFEAFCSLRFFSSCFWFAEGFSGRLSSPVGRLGALVSQVSFWAGRQMYSPRCSFFFGRLEVWVRRSRGQEERYPFLGPLRTRGRPVFSCWVCWYHFLEGGTSFGSSAGASTPSPLYSSRFFTAAVTCAAESPELSFFVCRSLRKAVTHVHQPFFLSCHFFVRDRPPL